MKRIILIFLASFIVLTLTSCSNNTNIKKTTVIATNFPGYDFARAVIKNSDDIDLKMLIKPGMDIHNFEPSPQDIKNIKNSDILIYVGGESDEWIKKIIKDLDTNKTKIVRLMDIVEVLNEETTEGMQINDIDSDEDEYDEHIWTNPNNAIKIVEKLKNEIISIDKKNEQLYENNANEYIEKLKKIDNEIKNIVNNSKRKELIFADRFPLLYFVKEYNLTYYAAFPGCAEQTEASAKTISFLINKIKEDKIPVIFKIELSNSKIATAIKNETNTKIKTFNTAHNISKNDFEKGITYIDLMNKNIKVLKEALN